MLNSPLVSVIIPAYNHEKYVQATIFSIVKQQYENIELIIIDDGSKDSTWQKINETKEVCEKRFVRTIFETKENGGTCETLNMLLGRAQGKYIYLIASDDLAKEHAIKVEVDFLENNSDYALVVGDNEIIDGEGKVAYWDKETNLVYNSNEAYFLSFAEQLKFLRSDIDFNSQAFGTYYNLLYSNHIPNGYLIRSSIFEKTGLFTKEAPLEDHWLHLQISKYAKIKFIDDILFSYRWHSANTVKQRERMIAFEKQTKIHEKKLLERLDTSKCLEEVHEFLRGDGLMVKRKGIKYLYEEIKYRGFQSKTKIIKIFNFTIAKRKQKIESPLENI